MERLIKKIQKVCLTAVILTFGVTMIQLVPVKADENTTLGYYEYDFGTKAEEYQEMDIPDTEGPIILDGSLGTLGAGTEENSGIEPFSVIGSDNRTLVPDTTVIPTRWIGYLLSYWPNGEVTRGTAWLYGTTVAATAGHCIYRTDLAAYPDRIVFYPGYNNGVAPYGSFSVTKATVTKQWKANADSRYDAGIIKLSSNIGKTLGFFTIRYDDDVNAYLNKSVWITGYPADREKGTGMYRMKGAIQNCTANNLYYQIDTYGGQSGSPIFFQDPANSDKRICIGIHTNGTTNTVDGQNRGVRICRIMCNWMKNTRTEWTQG